jgi:hypothetical protein
MVLRRVSMGFPAESVRAGGAAVDRRAMRSTCSCEPVPGSLRYGGPGGRLQRGLVIALRALDHRRGQILPRNAPPEIAGRARASMDLRGVRGSAAARCRQRAVHGCGGTVRAAGCRRLIQSMAGRGCSTGRRAARRADRPPDASSAIAELVERAATGARPAIAVTVPPRCADGADQASAVEATSNRRWPRLKAVGPSSSTVSTRRVPSDLGASWSG